MLKIARANERREKESREMQSEKDKKLKEAEKSRMVGFTSGTSEVRFLPSTLHANVPSYKAQQGHVKRHCLVYSFDLEDILRSFSSAAGGRERLQD